MNLIEPSSIIAWNPPECAFLKSARFDCFFTSTTKSAGEAQWTMRLDWTTPIVDEVPSRMSFGALQTRPRACKYIDYLAY